MSWAGKGSELGWKGRRGSFVCLFFNSNTILNDYFEFKINLNFGCYSPPLCRCAPSQQPAGTINLALMWMGGRLLGWSPSNRLQTAAWFCNRSTSARCVVAVAAFKEGWHPVQPARPQQQPCGFHCRPFTSGWMHGRTRSKQNLS